MLPFKEPRRQELSRKAVVTLADHSEVVSQKSPAKDSCDGWGEVNRLVLGGVNLQLPWSGICGTDTVLQHLLSLFLVRQTPSKRVDRRWQSKRELWLFPTQGKKKMWPLLFGIVAWAVMQCEFFSSPASVWIRRNTKACPWLALFTFYDSFSHPQIVHSTFYTWRSPGRQEEKLTDGWGGAGSGVQDNTWLVYLTEKGKAQSWWRDTVLWRPFRTR